MKENEIVVRNQAELRRQERMRGMNDRDIVAAWYRAEDAEYWKLTQRQEDMRRRMDQAKALFLARKTYTEVYTTIAEEFGVAISTARYDIAAAMKLFGDLERVPKEAHRARAVEMALETFAVAKEAGDAPGMAKATMAYMAATGVDKDDPDTVDLDKIMKERTYIEALDPALRELLLNFLAQSGGSVDTAKLFETIYAAKNEEYVEYEALPDDAGTDPK